MLPCTGRSPPHSSVTQANEQYEQTTPYSTALGGKIHVNNEILLRRFLSEHHKLSAKFGLTKPSGMRSETRQRSTLPMIYHPEQPADILSLGCGDAQDVLYTAYADLEI